MSLPFHFCPCFRDFSGLVRSSSRVAAWLFRFSVLSLLSSASLLSHFFSCAGSLLGSVLIFLFFQGSSVRRFPRLLTSCRLCGSEGSRRKGGRAPFLALGDVHAPDRSLAGVPTCLFSYVESAFCLFALRSYWTPSFSPTIRFHSPHTTCHARACRFLYNSFLRHSFGPFICARPPAAVRLFHSASLFVPSFLCSGVRGGKKRAMALASLCRFLRHALHAFCGPTLAHVGRMKL